jgi:phosphoribosyl-ATP pyrophosphohydrolase/phosphoribosyl-AMP cyclohydrolase/histidinol dehydrogenase
MTEILRRVAPEQIGADRRDPVDPATLEAAAGVVRDVRDRGERAVREHAERLGDVAPGAALVVGRAQMQDALAALPPEQRELLERTAARVRSFASAQRECLSELVVRVPGGSAGHTVRPVRRAGCYAPGGRFPLPSSVLMTAVTARAAGVGEVWVASPRPATATLAAAAIAGADALLAVGGAQAVAALAFGAGPVPACDVVVGPGNRWVTAAKALVAGRVGIDMLAGPSELVVLADSSAEPGLVAADLLAQAEHDPDALVTLVTTDESLVESVERELQEQLATLPTVGTARAALANGRAVVAGDLRAALEACERLAPEHLELMVRNPQAVASRVHAYGGLFVGGSSAEVLGDYGAGPNHVLPTGGTARHAGGLSVLDFLAVRTWLRIDDGGQARELVSDAAALARIEGLEAHARAAERRLGRTGAG